MFKWEKKSLLVKAEANYGVDSAPVVGSDAILARNVAIKPLRLVTDERSFVVPHFGNQGRLVAGKFVEIEFDVEMAGAGAAGDVPGYAPCLKACGLGETVNAGVSVVYAPLSPAVSADVSATIHFNVDGRRHKVVGCLGTLRMVLEGGKIPLFRFRFVGLYVLPTDTALAALTLTAFQKPVAVNNANTTPATLFTYAAKFRSMEIDLGNRLEYRNLPNSEAVRFLDRKSTARFMFEGELVATKDWWSIVTAETSGAFTVTQGTVAGNKVKVDAGQVQLGEPDMGNEGGVVMETYTADLRPTAAGNDELTITVL